MSSRSSWSFLSFAAAGMILLMFSAPAIWAQHGSEGTVTLTVLVDPAAEAWWKCAELELRDLTTNEVRKAETQEQGTHTFVNLSLGMYRLTVSKTGFQTQVFTNVVVQAAQTTDIAATLKVGAINEESGGEWRSGTAD